MEETETLTELENKAFIARNISFTEINKIHLDNEGWPELIKISPGAFGISRAAYWGRKSVTFRTDNKGSAIYRILGWYPDGGFFVCKLESSNG